MAKTPDFINPTVPKTINTISGTAHYVKTELEDEYGRWNDNYYTRDGYWVIHEGKHHHVYKTPPKGKGWHESPGRDGKAPIHKKVAERSQAKHAQNTPMKKMIKTEHRKLTEKERDRMIDMWASAPLDYKPIDDELIKLGLAQFWDNMPDAVENTDMPFYADNGSILPEWYDFKAERGRYDAERASKIKETTLFEKWVTHLKRLDPHGRGFEVFDYNTEEENVSKLNEILKGGQQALDDYTNELQEMNLEYQDEMFASSFGEFLKDEGIDRDTIENEDEFRIEFEGHINYNIEKLFDYDVLLLEKKHYEVSAGEITSSEIDVSSPEQSAFKTKALKYITDKQFKALLNNTWGGVGYFGIIIHASEIIKAIRKGIKTVSSNDLVVGIHDWMNGAGYFERATVKPNYEISLDNAMLDIDSYGIGAVFGTTEWNWR